jgi:hypothetical protein
VSEVPPPAPPPIARTVLPVQETPEQSSSDRQPAQEGSRQAPSEPAATPAPAHSDPAVKLSETLAHLQPGAQLEVSLTGLTPDGGNIVQSSVGQFLAESAIPLERSVQYVLEILNGGPNLRAVIVSANGQNLADRPEIQLLPRPLAGPGTQALPTYRPTPGATQVTSPTATPGIQATETATPSGIPLPPIEIGNLLGAALVTRHTEPGTTPTPIVAGSGLIVRILDLGPPPTANATPPSVAAGGPGLTTASVAASPAPTALSPEAAPSPPNRIQPLDRAQTVAQLFRGEPVPSTSGPTASGGQPPVAPENPRAKAATIATGIKGSPVSVGSPGAAPGTPGSIITGIAVTSAQDQSYSATPQPDRTRSASTPQTETAAQPNPAVLLRTPIGLMRLDTPDALKIGSTVALEVTAIRPPDNAPVREINAPLLNMAATWPLLDEVMATLVAADPALAAQTAQRVLPSASPRLGPNLLFFMAALNLGDARNWLGQAAAATLENAGRQDLLRRLGGEFARIRRAGDEPLARDPGSSEWRPTVFPFLDGNAIRPITLFTRHHRHENDSEEDRPDTRFVLEVDLSTLGPMQFDGLIRAKSFDLMIRSHSRLPDSMREDIGDIFRQNLENSGLEGGIQFQATRPFPLSPKDDYLKTQGSAADSVVV